MPDKFLRPGATCHMQQHAAALGEKEGSTADSRNLEYTGVIETRKPKELSHRIVSMLCPEVHYSVQRELGNSLSTVADEGEKGSATTCWTQAGQPKQRKEHEKQKQKKGTERVEVLCAPAGPLRLLVALSIFFLFPLLWSVCFVLTLDDAWQQRGKRQNEPKKQEEKGNKIAGTEHAEGVPLAESRLVQAAQAMSK
jgi:hypothetical protein